MGELVGTLALAQDNAFGQPLESQLRSCLLAVWMGEAAGFDREVRDTAYWVALLRYLGCTGHAHEVSTLFGDEIAVRAQTLVHDAANPAEVIRDVIAFATAGRPTDEREQIVQMIQEGAQAWAVHNFASGCEVGDMLAERLGFDPAVRNALGYTFERWNGAGYPNQARGEEIPLAMRIVHLTHDMEAHGRLFAADEALQTVRDRRGRTYDPELADLFCLHGEEWFARLATIEPWDAVLAYEPEPHRTLDGDQLDEALGVVADFVDLKSPYMLGHSRRCAQIAGDAATLAGLGEEEARALRRSALVHEIGTTVVPNSIWDKPGPLTRAELDRVEVHPMLTEQMLRRSPALRALNPVAATHHERCDGTGYHKGLRTGAVGAAAHLLAATDVYVGLTADRADRPAFSPDDAAAEVRRAADAGTPDPAACDAVLAAAGHGPGRAPGSRRARHPGGLTSRQAEVLKLAARGLTTRAIAEALHISPKTADHHIQGVYSKIGVSTRAAAALWATQHAIVA
jgi:HD-GYP domain-containing protein (c-di-GMP phosphodiesterase class II)